MHCALTMYSSLPGDILLLIASQIESSKDLLSYLRTNSLHYSLLVRTLYQKNVKSDGGSALIWFARRGSELGVRNMLAAGANVNIQGSARSRPTALGEAILHKHTHMVRMLLQNGANPDMPSSYSRRPLILATHGHCNLVVTKLLLEYGANVNRIGRDRHSPLLEAVRSNQEDKVALLLQHKADIHITEPQHGKSLLHVAAESNATPAIFHKLLRAGLEIDSQDDLGRTPLQVAAEHSCLRAVKELLSCEANPNFKNMNERTKGWTALFYASGATYYNKPVKAIVNALLGYGAHIDARNHLEQTPLLHAISRGAITQARELRAHGASISARDSNNDTVLHLAAATPYWTPDICMVRWLVDCKADVNLVGGPQGETPLFYAIRQTNGIERVQLLLSLNADVNFCNIYGETPLSVAARRRSFEMIRLLLEYGAAVNSQDRTGKYPLHHVTESSAVGTQKGHRIIALLIEYGAEVNCRDFGGYTPLHGIASREWNWKPYWEEVGELLRAGADRHAQSYDGRYPHDMVPLGGQAEAQRLILQHFDPFRFNP